MASPNFDLYNDTRDSDSDSTSRDDSGVGIEEESQESVGLFDEEDVARQGKETNISQLSDFSVMNDSQYSELYRSFEASQAAGVSDAAVVARTTKDDGTFRSFEISQAAAISNSAAVAARTGNVNSLASSSFEASQSAAISAALDAARAIVTNSRASASASTDDDTFWLTPRSQPVRVRSVGTQTQKPRKYLCVHLKKGKYQAFCKIQGKDIYIGRFDTSEEAALQVDTFILAKTHQLNRPRQLNFAHHAHKQYVYDTANKRHLAYPTTWTLPNDF